METESPSPTPAAQPLYRLTPSHTKQHLSERVLFLWRYIIDSNRQLVNRLAKHNTRNDEQPTDKDWVLVDVIVKEMTQSLLDAFELEHQLFLGDGKDEKQTFPDLDPNAACHLCGYKLLEVYIPFPCTPTVAVHQFCLMHHVRTHRDVTTCIACRSSDQKCLIKVAAKRLLRYNPQTQYWSAKGAYDQAMSQNKNDSASSSTPPSSASSSALVQSASNAGEAAELMALEPFMRGLHSSSDSDATTAPVDPDLRPSDDDNKARETDLSLSVKLQPLEEEVDYDLLMLIGELPQSTSTKKPLAKKETNAEEKKKKEKKKMKPSNGKKKTPATPKPSKPKVKAAAAATSKPAPNSKPSKPKSSVKVIDKKSVEVSKKRKHLDSNSNSSSSTSFPNKKAKVTSWVRDVNASMFISPDVTARMRLTLARFSTMSLADHAQVIQAYTEAVALFGKFDDADQLPIRAVIGRLLSMPCDCPNHECSIPMSPAMRGKYVAFAKLVDQVPKCQWLHLSWRRLLDIEELSRALIEFRRAQPQSFATQWSLESHQSSLVLAPLSLLPPPPPALQRPPSPPPPPQSSAVPMLIDSTPQFVHESQQQLQQQQQQPMDVETETMTVIPINGQIPQNQIVGSVERMMI
jgi:hypothetical protein